MCYARLRCADFAQCADLDWPNCAQLGEIPKQKDRNVKDSQEGKLILVMSGGQDVVSRPYIRPFLSRSVY